MISRIEYAKLVDGVAEFNNAAVTAAEALGVYAEDSAANKFMDKVLSFLVNDTVDEGIDKLPDVKVEYSSDYGIDPDVPLLYFYCWDLNFGDGNRDGDIATITIEGIPYKLDTAARLYDCVNHLRQLRCHYAIGEEATNLFDAGM